MISLFTTPRLGVHEITRDASQEDVETLIACVPALFTPGVVENLPPYFHDIGTAKQATSWFERMIGESRLFVVSHASTGACIGFIFVYAGDKREAHIGYLLGEDYWGQGLASEVLTGFISHTQTHENWSKLIGGVDRSNLASSKLLSKLGFIAQPGSENQSDNENNVIFYEYKLSD